MSHASILLRALLLLGAWPLLFLIPVRLVWPTANDIVALLAAILFPWSAVVVLLRARRRWADAAGGVLGVLLLFYTASVGLIAVFTLGGYRVDRDLGFDQFAEFWWNGSAVRMYRTDGGALTDFGVVVRQERDLVPGLLLIRDIDSWNSCYELLATPTDSGIEIRNAKDGCSTFGHEPRRYALHRFVYF